jgi:PTS system mannitol-specific IIC component
MLRTFKGKSLEEAQQEMAREKAKAKGLPLPTEIPAVKNSAGVKKVIFACDAGMGSSAMGATKFRNRIKAQRPDLTVKNTSVDNIPSDCDIAVVQITLVDRARKCAPNAQIVTINNFLADPALDSLFEQLTAKEETAVQQAAEGTKEAVPETAETEENGEAKKEVMVREGIKLNLGPVSKEEAIQAAGELLAELGYVDASYIPAMQEREKLVTTYMGMGVAIPHGTSQAKGTVKKTGIVLLQYPEGVDFGDEKAQLVFGIAGIGDEHLDLLSKICGMLEDEEVLEKLKTTSDIDWVFDNLK